MTRCLPSAAAALLVSTLLASNPVFAGTHNGLGQLYLSGHLGATKPTTRSYVDPTDVGNNYRIKSDYGFGFGGALGYRMDDWRTELAVTYTDNDASTTTVNTVAPFNVFVGEILNDVGKTKATTFMLNTYYDFHDNEFYGMNPYLGIGLGAAHLKQSITNSEAAAIDNITISGNDTVFAYQGIVGVGCTLNKNLRGTIDYRYLGTAKAKFNLSNNNESTTVKGHYVSHQFNLGLTYYFS